MTGFYVANVVSRYWDQFLSLPMPDKLAYKLVAYVQGQVNQFLIAGARHKMTASPLDTLLQQIFAFKHFNFDSIFV